MIDDASLGSPDKGPPPNRGRATREALLITVVVSIATAAAIRYAFAPAQAGRREMLMAMGGVYLIALPIALARMARRGELRSLFRPAPGDVAFAAIVAGCLYGLAHVVARFAAGPGSPREAWLMRLYLQIGEPEARFRGVAVLVIAALEEIVWRGLVMRELQATMGYLRALALSSVLFAAAHAPTLLSQADPRAGPNPLIVLAGLGCSVVWGGMFLRARRLVPAVLAHALFSWAIVEFPIWRL